LFNIDKVIGDTIYFEKRAELENVLPVQVYIYEYIQTDCKPKRKELPPSELINTDKRLALTSTLKINTSGIENKRLNIYTEQTRLPIIYNEDYKTLNIASTGSLLSVSVSKKNLTINNDKYSKYSDKELLFFDDNEQYLIRTNGKNIKLTKSELTNLNFYQYNVSLIAQQNRLIVKLPEEQTTIPVAVSLTCSDNRLLKELRQDIVFDTTNIELTAEQSRLQVPIILDEPEYNPITVKFDVQINFDNDKNYNLPITMQIINNRSLMLTELKQTTTNIGYRIGLSVENSELISA
jgi:hypothetical protein